MNTQPEALRLIGIFDAAFSKKVGDGWSLQEQIHARNELERLHHENEAIKAQRDELLLALKRIKGATMSMYATRSDMLEDCQDIARAAIDSVKVGAV